MTLTWNVAPAIKVQGMTPRDGHRDGRARLPLPLAHQHRPREPGDADLAPRLLLDLSGEEDRHVLDARLAEDTWALNEGVIDDATFLQQTYDIDRERQDMFFAALDRLRRGSLVCVFDATDRIQHMFWRYTEKGHPADRSAAGRAAPRRRSRSSTSTTTRWWARCSTACDRATCCA